MRARHLMIALSLILQLAAFAPALRAQAAPQNVPQKKNETAQPRPAGAPVVVQGKTLFYVPSRMFTLSPQDRTQTIAQRIVWLSSQTPDRIRAVHAEDLETTTVIVSGDVVIATVTDNDAKAVGESRQKLVQQYIQAIQSTALALRGRHSLRAILLGALYALLVTALVIAAFKLLGYTFRKLYGKLEAWHGVYIRSIRIQRLELIPADRISSLLYTAARSLRILLSLVLLYAYVGIVTSFFPWTQGYASVLLDYSLAPLLVVWVRLTSYLPNLFFLVVIFVVAFYLSKFVKCLFREIGRGTLSLPGFYAEWATPTYKIARFLMVMFTLIVAFPHLPGSKSPAFQGVSIFFGLLISPGILFGNFQRRCWNRADLHAGFLSR